MNDELIIRGGKRLKGNIKIQGSKNLVVSLIPAKIGRASCRERV